MDTVLKATAGVLMAVVLYQVLSKNGKDIALLLMIAVCCMILFTAIRYLQPVISFFEKVQVLCEINSNTLSILMKSVGISLLAEITGLICRDMGNGALEKSLQILASVSILIMSLPLFNDLLDLIKNVLGSI